MYLNGEQSHGDQADPAVQRVKVRNGFRSFEVMRIQHSQEANGDAWYGQGVEHSVQQFHVDPATAATDAIQENCYKKKYKKF